MVVHGLDIGTVQESLHTSPRAGRTRSGPVLWSRRPGIAVQGLSGAFSGGGSRRRRGRFGAISERSTAGITSRFYKKAPETLEGSATGWLSRVEERRVAGRGRWLIRRFRNRAAGRVPWVRFLPPLSEPGGPISGTGLSSGIMRLAHGLPGHDQRTGLASPGTRLAPLSRPAGASSGLLTPWRRRPLGSSPSLVHVMTSGIPAHLRGDRPFGHSREPAPFRHRFHLRSLPSAGITRLPRYLRTSPPP